MTEDIFRARLEQRIELKHPLAVRASPTAWAQIEAVLSPGFARKRGDGKLIEDGEPFGTTVRIAGGGLSAAGRPRLSIRLMASLLYLKHAYNLSEEERVERWAENAVWQYFSAQVYNEPKLPRDASEVGRIRSAIGEAGVEELLKATIDTAVGCKARKPYEFGLKASIAVSHRSGLRVGARTFPGTPYSGHILKAQLEQATIVLEDTGTAPWQLIVELGFRGVDQDNPDVQIIHRGTLRSLTSPQRRWLKRRRPLNRRSSTSSPTIGCIDAGRTAHWAMGCTPCGARPVTTCAGCCGRWCGCA